MQFYVAGSEWEEKIFREIRLGTVLHPLDEIQVVARANEPEGTQVSRPTAGRKRQIRRRFSRFSRNKRAGSRPFCNAWKANDETRKKRRGYKVKMGHRQRWRRRRRVGSNETRKRKRRKFHISMASFLGLNLNLYIISFHGLQNLRFLIIQVGVSFLLR